jgi:hypothetical protein
MRILAQDSARDTLRDVSGFVPDATVPVTILGGTNGGTLAHLPLLERGAPFAGFGLRKPPSWSDATTIPLRGSKRPPSWALPADRPLRGSSCSCCGLGRWWCERDAPTGWRCWACHPPDHLAPERVLEVRDDGHKDL